MGRTEEMDFLLKRRKLFGNNIPPACEYCLNSQYSGDRQLLFCTHSGIVVPSYQCKKFVYDPIRRIPHIIQKLPQFSPDDFKL